MTTNDVYGDAPRRAFAQELNDLGDAGTTVRCALLSSDYTPDRTNHEVWDDLSTYEVSGTNYTAGGTEITNATLEHTGGQTTFDGDDAIWADSTITAAYAVVYDDTPTDDVDKSLICLVDLEGEESSEDGEFRVEWNTAGIFEANT